MTEVKFPLEKDPKLWQKLLVEKGLNAPYKKGPDSWIFFISPQPKKDENPDNLPTELPEKKWRAP